MYKLLANNSMLQPLISFYSMHGTGEGYHSAEDGLDSIPELDNCEIRAVVIMWLLSDSLSVIVNVFMTLYLTSMAFTSKCTVSSTLQQFRDISIQL